MMTIIGRLWRAAVSSSIEFKPNEPSPWISTTCLSGRATFAPTANGMPTPIVPNVPEFMRCLGINVGIDCRPKFRISWPSTTSTPSRSMKSRTSLHSRSGCMGVLLVDMAFSASGALRLSISDSRPRQPAYKLDLTRVPEASSNCFITILASPVMATSTRWLPLISLASMSMRMILALAETRGGLT